MAIYDSRSFGKRRLSRSCLKKCGVSARSSAAGPYFRKRKKFGGETEYGLGGRMKENLIKEESKISKRSALRRKKKKARRGAIIKGRLE